jgi:hypothetical protein
MTDFAPIVLFIYNRPDHTRRTLAALAENLLAAESDLIIYADGPKNPEHGASVTKAREVAREAVGFRSVKIVERDTNMGLANSVITGVTEICASRGRVIVVEDDLIISTGFLSFLNAALDRYANDHRVFQISGYMFPEIGKETDAVFLPFISTWGWATWQRAWKCFDPSAPQMLRLKADLVLRRKFDLNNSYPYFEMLRRQQHGLSDSWGVRWYLSVFFESGLVLFPGRSFVTNIGVDGSGTHGAGDKSLQAIRPGSSDLTTMRMPDGVAVDRVVMIEVEALLRRTRPKGLARRIAWCRQVVGTGLMRLRK